jgi:hypothetical protein
MFTVTTYKVSSLLGLHDPTDVIRSDEEREPIKLSKDIFLSAYIHGEAQGIADYDIPQYMNGEITEEPEQECIMDIDGSKYDCILVMWDTGEIRENITVNQRRFRGLICLQSDESSLTYARECASDKRDMI